MYVHACNNQLASSRHKNSREKERGLITVPARLHLKSFAFWATCSALIIAFCSTNILIQSNCDWLITCSQCLGLPVVPRTLTVMLTHSNPNPNGYISWFTMRMSEKSASLPLTSSRAIDVLQQVTTITTLWPSPNNYNMTAVLKPGMCECSACIEIKVGGVIKERMTES